jgi:4Fe-4S single cluster domain
MGKKLLEDIFSNPQFYRDQLLGAKLIEGNQKSFSGKTFICVSLTRFCPVGCSFCFFKSGKMFKKPTIADKFSDLGVNKFIEFANHINLGYLLVSGGGEPMIEKKSLLRIINQVKSERIVLVTSANWAKSYIAADEYLAAIEKELETRTTPTSLTVRVSVDAEHVSSIGLDPIVNLVKLFQTKYSRCNQMDLQIHSLVEDPTVNEVISLLEPLYTISRQMVYEDRISDGKSVIKVVPHQEMITFDNLTVKVGYAKAFFSDLKVDLSNQEHVERNLAVYQKDLFESEDGNSSIVTNKIGEPGLDFWVNYNGNITTWGNQFLDNLFNMYVDSPADVVRGSLSDPAALAFIEKGAVYRDKVVSEANARAVIRSKAVNIRDYTGALMFDEARTRLYFTLRALQDYRDEGRIEASKIPPTIKDMLSFSVNDLVAAYRNAPYTIVQQTMEQEFDKEWVLDLMEWIRLGHYDLSEADKQTLLDFYNKNVGDSEKMSSYEDLSHDLRLQNVRMTEHLTHIKLNALDNEMLAA